MSIQAEKSTLALRRHHPELKDVWGDVERDIVCVVPKKAEQPSNLKVQLLPFQLESLSWFKEQEKSIWSGGMLAVRRCITPRRNHADVSRDAQ